MIFFSEHIQGASLVTQLTKNSPTMRETLVRFLGQEDPLEKDRLLTLIFLGITGGSDSKESTCNAGDLSAIPGLGRAPGRGHGNPLQYSLPGESPWTEVPGGLESVVLLRVGHN